MNALAFVQSTIPADFAYCVVDAETSKKNLLVNLCVVQQGLCAAAVTAP